MLAGGGRRGTRESVSGVLGLGVRIKVCSIRLSVAQKADAVVAMHRAERHMEVVGDT